MSTVEIRENTLERPLITPEGVDLKIQLASAGERAGAFLIDAVLIILCLVVLTFASFAAAAMAGFKNAEFAAVIWTLGSFLLTSGWFIGFELTSFAATPGKRALGLRVAARNGGRLTAEAIIARNLMRHLEILVPVIAVFSGGNGEAVDSWMQLAAILWAGIFALFPLFNRDRLRPGDLIAGTWVVHAPRRSLLRDLADDGPVSQANFPFTRTQLEAYGVKELHVLEDVLRIADRKVMAAVAERIRHKIGWTRGAEESDAAFLSAYYTALRGRLESGLLFGKRKRDKFDR